MRRLLAALLLLAAPAAATEGFPVKLGGPFRLTDQNGAIRTEADPAGRPQLLFFGYATCEAICSVALPTMAEAAALIRAGGAEVVPVMITVDPARDTAETLGPALARHDPAMVGLTGDAATLAEVWRRWGVEVTKVYDAPTGPVYAHGSFVYLLDGTGRVLSVLPPILSAERIAEIVRDRLGT